MSEELYNSNDYCKLAEEFEELKNENAELARDKDHLMNLFMESSEYVFNVVSNMKINDLGQKCKRLEADYEISNRELLVKQVEITALRAELEANKERLNSCESALISMVNQFFYNKDGEDVFRHAFMSAEEEAADYLVEHGIARWVGKNKSAICFNEVQE